MESIETGELQRQVTEAVDGLQAQIQAVEIWAAAMVVFAQPVAEDEMRIRGVEVLGR